jgi:hypothetical protein
LLRKEGVCDFVVCAAGDENTAGALQIGDGGKEVGFIRKFAEAINEDFGFCIRQRRQEAQNEIFDFMLIGTSVRTVVVVVGDIGWEGQVGVEELRN